MARLIRHEQMSPYIIEKSDIAKVEKDFISICGCGRSAELPFCDGTHKQCRAQEQEGKLYVWEGDAPREVEMP